MSGGERVDIYRLIKGLSGGERREERGGRREERLAGDGETFSGAQSVPSPVLLLALRWKDQPSVIRQFNITI